MYKKLLATMMAGALGFALNGFSVAVYPGVTLIFGGLFYLLIATRLGPAYGLAAALMASSRTLLLWDHPYAIPAFALEGLAVGFLIRRRKPLILADLLYWAMAGIPLNILIFVLYLKEPWPVGWAIVFKQPLNGLLNAVVVEVMLGFAFLRRFLAPEDQPDLPLPLRLHLAKGFVIVAALPLILLSLVYGQVYINLEKEEASNRLSYTAKAVRLNLDDYLQYHLQAIASLAADIEQSGSLKTEDLNQRLERFHKTYSRFITALAADKEGRLIGAHPLKNAEGQSVLASTSTIADREYFKQLLATRRPFISDVFLGRGFGNDPVVAISAPLLSKEGRATGIVVGSLNLSLFAEFGQRYQASREAEIIILDSASRVIHATPSTQYQPLEDLSDAPVVAAALKAGEGSFTYDTGSAEAGSGHLMAQAVIDSVQWRVLIRQPMSVVYRPSQRHYLMSILSALLGLLFSILLARWIGNRITQPIEQVVEQVRETSLQGTRARQIVAPQDVPSEAVALIDEFNFLSVRMVEAYRRLRNSIKEREALNRTLQKSEEKFSRIFLLSPDAIIISRLSDGTIKEANENFLDRLGFSRKEVIGKTVPELDFMVNPSDRDAFLLALREKGEADDLEIEVRAKGGRISSVLLSGRTLDIDGEPCVISIARNITERKQMEAALRKAHDELESRVRERTEELAQVNDALRIEIAERTQAQEAMRALEERFSKAFNASPIAITIVTFNEGRYIDVNEAFVRSFEASRQEVIGRTVKEVGVFVDPKDQARVARMLSERGRVQNEEIRFRSKTGRIGIHSYSAELMELGGQLCVLGQTVDITERKRAEAALEASEKKFRALIENSSDAIALIAPDATLLYASPSIQKILDYVPEEFLGRSAFEFLHPQDKDRALKTLIELFQRPGGISRMEYRLRHKDGTWVWMDAVGTNLLADVDVKAIVINHRDITERKRAEAALRASEERFAKAFKSSPRPMSIVRLRDRVFIDVNESVLRMTGYLREEVIGRTPVDIGLWHSLEDRDRVMELLKEDGRVRNLEVVFRVKSGEMRQGLFSAEIIELEGEPCLLTTTDDITERRRAEDALRESEHRYRHLVDNASDIIYETDAKGHITLFNPTATRMLGYDEEDLRGRLYLDLIRPDYRDAIEAFYKKQIAERVPSTYYEFPALDKDGGEVWFGQNVQLVMRGDEVAGAQAVARNITERRRAEDALRESEERFSKAFHASSHHLIITSLEDGRFIAANETFLRESGYTREEIIGRTVLEAGLLVNTEDRDKVREMIAREGRVRDMETMGRTKSGEVRYGLLSAEIIDLMGKKCMLFDINDITERRRAEEELREREVMLRTLGDNLPDGAIYQYVVEPDGRHYFNYLSAGIEKISGIRAEDAMRDAELLFAQFLPQDRQRILRATEQSAENLTIFDQQARRCLPGGEIRWMHYRSKPRRLPNGATVWDGVEVDITERRQAEDALRKSEERFFKAFNASPMPMAISRDRQFIEVNNCFLNITGYARDEIIGREIDDTGLFIYPSDMERIGRALREQGSVRDLELSMRMKTGEVRVVLYSAEIIELGGQRCLLAAAIDITDRKRAEDALRESEARLMMALDAAHMGTWEMDIATGRLKWSGQQYKMYGLPPGSFEGTTDALFEIVHPEDREKISRSAARAIKEGVEHNPEYRIVRPDGTIRWMSVKGRVVRDDEGRAVRMVGIVQDITERKQAEDALRESEEHLRMALDGASMVTWDWDLLADRVEWSGQPHKLYGIAPGEAPANSESLLDLVHPEDRDALRQVVVRAFNEGTEYAGEYRVIWPDGNIRWLSARGEIFRDPEGRPLRTVGVVQDITERKRAEDALRASEEKYRDLVEDLQEIIYEVDDKGRITYISPAIETFSGYHPSEVIGRSFAEFVYPDDLPHTLESFQKNLMGNNEPNEFRVATRSGEIRWVQSSSKGVFADGRTMGVHGVIMDITERKRAEEELHRAKEAAEAASRAKSEFLANMSHEIRTPMNGLMGMLDLTLRTEMTARQKEFLHMARSSADSLLRLLNDILDFSRIEARKLELETTAFRLRSSLDEAMNSLSVQAHAKGLEKILDIDPDVPDALIGDIGRLNQVIGNLVSNAIKFTDRGEVAIRVETRSQDEDQVCLEVSVSDTGIGISDDKKKIIFDAFTQADSSTTRQYGGTGLGLAISSHLVEMMRGVIWVKSEEGRGSAFYFTACFGLQKEIAAAVEPENLKGVRALVVDDNETNRRLLVAMLEDWGLRATAVADGTAALEQMRLVTETAAAFQLVILDSRMPGIEGLETARQMKENKLLDGATILMLLSADQPAQIEQCREIGIEIRLRKPVSRERLMRAVSAAMRPTDIKMTSARRRGEMPALSHSLRVLLAEDSLLNQKLVVTLLEERGHSVTAVGTGKQAVERFDQESFDVIVMDVQMPEMDGFEATRAIREMEKQTSSHTPIIALTAHAMKGDRERCIASGMDGYIAKPIRVEELLGVIEGWAGESWQLIEEETAEAAFDLDAVMRRTRGRMDLIKSFAETFKHQSPGLLAQAREALRAGDGDWLERAAHTLRGSLSYFSARAATRAALLLEEHARGGKMDEAEAAYLMLEEEIARLENAFDDLLPEN